WVSRALARSCRSNPANPSPGCSATAQRLSQLPPALNGPAREGPTLKAYADLITPATPSAPASQPGRGKLRTAGTRPAGACLAHRAPPPPDRGPAAAAAAAPGRAGRFMWVLLWAVAWAVACGEPAGRW